MISCVHSNYNLRNQIINNDVGKPSGIFIKDITNKLKDEGKKADTETIKIKDIKTKKWEAKKKVQFQINETTKEIVQEKGSGSTTVKQTTSPTITKVLTLGMTMKPTVFYPLNMLSMLS